MQRTTDKLRDAAHAIGEAATANNSLDGPSVADIAKQAAAQGQPQEVLFQVGDRVKFNYTKKDREGLVAFDGETQFAKGRWIGIIADDPAGKNDGLVQEVRYFTCEDNHGIFLRAEKVLQVIKTAAQLAAEAASRTDTSTAVPLTVPAESQASQPQVSSTPKTPKTTPSAAQSKSPVARVSVAETPGNSPDSPGDSPQKRLTMSPLANIDSDIVTEQKRIQQKQLREIQSLRRLATKDQEMMEAQSKKIKAVSSELKNARDACLEEFEMIQHSEANAIKNAQSAMRDAVQKEVEGIVQDLISEQVKLEAYGEEMKERTALECEQNNALAVNLEKTAREAAEHLASAQAHAEDRAKTQAQVAAMKEEQSLQHELVKTLEAEAEKTIQALSEELAEKEKAHTSTAKHHEHLLNEHKEDLERAQTKLRTVSGAHRAAEDESAAAATALRREERASASRTEDHEATLESLRSEVTRAKAAYSAISDTHITAEAKTEALAVNLKLMEQRCASQNEDQDSALAACRQELAVSKAAHKSTSEAYREAETQAEAMSLNLRKAESMHVVAVHIHEERAAEAKKRADATKEDHASLAAEFSTSEARVMQLQADIRKERLSHSTGAHNVEAMAVEHKSEMALLQASHNAALRSRKACETELASLTAELQNQEAIHEARREQADAWSAKARAEIDEHSRVITELRENGGSSEAGRRELETLRTELKSAQQACTSHADSLSSVESAAKRHEIEAQQAASDLKVLAQTEGRMQAIADELHSEAAAVRGTKVQLESARQDLRAEHMAYSSLAKETEALHVELQKRQNQCIAQMKELEVSATAVVERNAAETDLKALKWQLERERERSQRSDEAREAHKLAAPELEQALHEATTEAAVCKRLEAKFSALQADLQTKTVLLAEKSGTLDELKRELSVAQVSAAAAQKDLKTSRAALETSEVKCKREQRKRLEQAKEIEANAAVMAKKELEAVRSIHEATAEARRAAEVGIDALRGELAKEQSLRQAQSKELQGFYTRHLSLSDEAASSDSLRPVTRRPSVKDWLLDMWKPENAGHGGTQVRSAICCARPPRQGRSQSSHQQVQDPARSSPVVLQTGSS